MPDEAPMAPPTKWLGRYHEVALLLLGFVLTTGVGSILTRQIQTAAAQREVAARRADAERQRANQVYDETSRIAGQLLARISARDASISYVVSMMAHAQTDRLRISAADAQTFGADIKKFGTDLNQSVEEWSNASFRLKPLVEAYFGEKAANAFEALHGALDAANRSVTGRMPAIAIISGSEKEWRQQMGTDEQISAAAMTARIALATAAQALSVFTKESVQALRAQE